MSIVHEFIQKSTEPLVWYKRLFQYLYFSKKTYSQLEDMRRRQEYKIDYNMSSWVYNIIDFCSALSEMQQNKGWFHRLIAWLCPWVKTHVHALMSTKAYQHWQSIQTSIHKHKLKNPLEYISAHDVFFRTYESTIPPDETWLKRYHALNKIDEQYTYMHGSTIFFDNASLNTLLSYPNPNADLIISLLSRLSNAGWAPRNARYQEDNFITQPTILSLLEHPKLVFVHDVLTQLLMHNTTGGFLIRWLLLSHPEAKLPDTITVKSEPSGTALMIPLEHSVLDQSNAGTLNAQRTAVFLRKYWPRLYLSNPLPLSNKDAIISVVLHRCCFLEDPEQHFKAWQTANDFINMDSKRLHEAFDTYQAYQPITIPFNQWIAIAPISIKDIRSCINRLNTSDYLTQQREYLSPLVSNPTSTSIRYLKSICDINDAKLFGNGIEPRDISQCSKHGIFGIESTLHFARLFRCLSLNERTVENLSFIEFTDHCSRIWSFNAEHLDDWTREAWQAYQSALRQFPWIPTPDIQGYLRHLDGFDPKQKTFRPTVIPILKTCHQFADQLPNLFFEALPSILSEPDKLVERLAMVITQYQEQSDGSRVLRAIIENYMVLSNGRYQQTITLSRTLLDSPAARQLLLMVCTDEKKRVKLNIEFSAEPSGSNAKQELEFMTDILNKKSPFFGQNTPSLYLPLTIRSNQLSDIRLYYDLFSKKNKKERSLPIGVNFEMSRNNPDIHPLLDEIRGIIRQNDVNFMSAWGLFRCGARKVKNDNERVSIQKINSFWVLDRIISFLLPHYKPASFIQMALLALPRLPLDEVVESEIEAINQGSPVASQ